MNKVGFIIAGVVVVVGVAVLLGVFLLGVAGAGFFYFQRKTSPAPPVAAQPAPLNVAELKLVDMSGPQKDTQQFLRGIYEKQGLEGVRAWLETNVKAPCNIRIAYAPDGVNDYQGVTYVRLSRVPSSQPQTVAEWGEAWRRGSKIYILNVFPPDKEYGPDTFGLTLNYQESAPAR